MRHANALLILSLIILPSCGIALSDTAATPASQVILEIRFHSWINGEFDNRQQVTDEAALNVATELRHPVAHFSLVTFKLKGHEGDASYVEQHRNADPRQVTYQRVWTHSFEPATKQMVSRIHELPTGRTIRRGDLDTLTLDTLKPIPDGCEIRWTLQGEQQFHGRQSPQTCRRKLGQQDLQYADTLLLSATEFWTNTDIRDLAGQKVFGHKAGVPLAMRRIP